MIRHSWLGLEPLHQAVIGLCVDPEVGIPEFPQRVRHVVSVLKIFAEPEADETEFTSNEEPKYDLKG
jgi:hypothetical protein